MEQGLCFITTTALRQMAQKCRAHSARLLAEPTGNSKRAPGAGYQTRLRLLLFVRSDH